MYIMLCNYKVTLLLQYWQQVFVICVYRPFELPLISRLTVSYSGFAFIVSMCLLPVVPI